MSCFGYFTNIISYCGDSNKSKNAEYNLIDENILSWMKEDTSCGCKLIKQKEEVLPNEVKYRKYRINNEPELVIDNIGYYIARNWGVNNIDKLINQINYNVDEIFKSNHLENINTEEIFNLIVKMLSSSDTLYNILKEFFISISRAP